MNRIARSRSLTILRDCVSRLPLSTAIARRRLALLILTIIGILPALLMWHLVSRHWVPIPLWDEWYTPGSQFASWCRGTLTITELFSQHNESRKFFPRLLYFALAAFGGWDVRKEMRVVFILVCGLSLLLLRLLRRTAGATAVSTLIGWSLTTFLCFAPIQVENFLYGIELETFFPGAAVIAAATVNLSRLSFRAKTLGNLALAVVANYTFANGILLWVLAWPWPAPNESISRRHRIFWSGLYLIAAAISIGCYFIGYHRPDYHPQLASISARFWDLVHYFVLWIGNYFASDLAGSFPLGICALSLFVGATSFTLWTAWQRGDWRTYYPWWLIGFYACASGAVTAIGRLGFGLQQALETRYTVFTLFFYIALSGMFFAIYCSRVRFGPSALRASFLTNAIWLVALLALLWTASYKKNLIVLSAGHKSRLHLLHTLEWIEPIPDNPDLALVFPFVQVLRDFTPLLEKHRILRLPFIHGSLARSVRQSPPATDGARGQIESCDLDSNGAIHVTGWAWLPERNRPADCVVLGCEDRFGRFKPITVLETGSARPDLRDAKHDPHMYRAGFARDISTANFPSGSVSIKGWAIDLHARKSWALASSFQIEQRKTFPGAPNESAGPGAPARNRPIPRRP